MGVTTGCASDASAYDTIMVRHAVQDQGMVSGLMVLFGTYNPSFLPTHNFHHLISHFLS